MSDLVERARKFAKWGLYGGEPVDRSDFTAWADRIEELERALENLCIHVGMGWETDEMLEKARAVLEKKP
jgi:hypothetical protein